MMGAILERISVLNNSLLELRAQFADEPEIYEMYSQALIWERDLLNEEMRTLHGEDGVDHGD